MPTEFNPGCERPAKKEKSPSIDIEVQNNEEKKEEQVMLKVGKPVPEFTAPAYYQGKFMNVDLSEYKGKWLLLCFYPGDFTFV
ncbi:peroxiredoxin (alkyl hydroperoxide reductase subunit C) [Texcoconibacillus texcoconensis]|uniref:Peroxiredoxin (Alkyl hydroperoxide reductase subunit C) n=2 Tax=Texcoconibacillus texcoconensis TaxID=1095777 RepID=A0A840QKQ3_9BACI|nr:peroxiredoxin (alkyl hydroperoxide reductase subunit C) [Texcoconibacillus texcoconensis]